MKSLLLLVTLLLQVFYSLGVGLEQTPININACYKRCHSPVLFFNYNTLVSAVGSSFKIKNSNYGLLTYTGAPTPYIVGGPLSGLGAYVFHSMHMHWGASDYGSEHTIEGKHGAAEMHFVHFKSSYTDLTTALNYKDGVAVVGIVFILSDYDNPDLNVFLQAHTSIVTYGSTYTFISNPLSWIGKYFKDNPGFITYNGSLTTYSYNEAVTWILLYKAPPISRNQLNQLRILQNHHAEILYEFTRSRQRLNGRRIRCQYCHRRHHKYSRTNLNDTIPFDIKLLDEDESAPLPLDNEQLIENDIVQMQK